MRNKLKAIILSLTLCGIIAVTVSTVGAHAELKSAKPGPGEIVKAPPMEIELVFSEPMEASQVMLYQTEDNSQIELDQAGPDPSEIIEVAITEAIPEGEYTVFWQTVAVDGHMLTGSYNFAYRAEDPVSILDRPWFQGLAILIFFIVLGASIWLRYRPQTCQPNSPT